jgi:hypothetical protein
MEGGERQACYVIRRQNFGPPSIHRRLISAATLALARGSQKAAHASMSL